MKHMPKPSPVIAGKRPEKMRDKILQKRRGHTKNKTGQTFKKNRGKEDCRIWDRTEKVELRKKDR